MCVCVCVCVCVFVSFDVDFVHDTHICRHGQPLWRCIFYGQLSGMVEPIGGLLGAFAGSLRFSVRFVVGDREERAALGERVLSSDSVGSLKCTLP